MRNELIGNAIKNQEPFLAGKFGSVELRLLYSYLNTRTYSKSLAHEAIINAGIFPNDAKTLKRFCTEYKNLLPEIDLLGKWKPLELQELMIKKFCKPEVITPVLRTLEPYYHDEPWSKYLENKTVLVVSPFSKSIEQQYAKKDLIWPNGVLPEFKLKTLCFPHSPALTGNEICRLVRFEV